MFPMRTKLLRLLVFAPWLWLGVFDPLIQPLYQGQLIADEHRNQVPVAGLWWVSEVLSADDSKVTTASCAEQSADAAGEVARDAGFGPLAAQPAVPRVVNIHELVCVYLI
jgi:hypothetical protein